MKKLLFILIGIATFVGCKKKTTPVSAIDVGADYYPVALGKYCVYDVDSIVYDEFTFDSTHYKYRIKEKFEEQFKDSEGKPAWRLMRYIKKFSSVKPYDSIPWTVKDAWQVNVNTTNVEVVEENVRFTKLIFPLKTGSVWDGNVRNTLGEWDYTYSYTNQPESFFDKVSLVTQKDFRTLISWQKYTEKYAKNVGLVYREIIDIKYPVTSTSTSIENIPNKQGIIYNLNIVSNGYE